VILNNEILDLVSRSGLVDSGNVKNCDSHECAKAGVSVCPGSSKCEAKGGNYACNCEIAFAGNVCNFDQSNKITATTNTDIDEFKANFNGSSYAFLASSGQNQIQAIEVNFLLREQALDVGNGAIPLFASSIWATGRFLLMHHLSSESLFFTIQITEHHLMKIVVLQYESEAFAWENHIKHKVDFVTLFRHPSRFAVSINDKEEVNLSRPRMSERVRADVAVDDQLFIGGVSNAMAAKLGVYQEIRFPPSIFKGIYGAIGDVRVNEKSLSFTRGFQKTENVVPFSS
ncbi:hypothetical protein Ciccas_008786, partial [Cichlidogyrus casuarinus]